MTQPTHLTSNQSQTNWPMIRRAKNFILDEKNTTFKIVKLLSSIILFPLALFLDLAYKGGKICWTGFSEYVKQSLAKKRGPPKKSLAQKINTIWTNYKRTIVITTAAVIFSSFFVFLYYNRPLIPDENIARKYENLLVKINRLNIARKKCVNNIQDSFSQKISGLTNLYNKVKGYQKNMPLVDETNTPNQIPTVEDIDQEYQELGNNRIWAIDDCNKKFFQEIAEILWPITNQTYFQGLFASVL